MSKSLYGTVLAVTLATFAGGRAEAQTVWEGGYAGGGVNWQASSGSEAKAVIDPGLHEQFTYELAPMSSSQAGAEFDATLTPLAFVGWRMSLGGLVAGIEARYQEGGAETAWTTDEVAQTMYRACGDPILGCVTYAADAVSADVSVERSVALRATIGIPVSDRLLVSAYAGPAIMWGRVTITQETDFITGRRPVLGVDCSWTCPPSIDTSFSTQSVTRTVDDTAMGLVVGATFDLVLSDRWFARGDIGYTRYEAIRGAAGRANGADSEVRAQSEGVQASVGIGFNF